MDGTGTGHFGDRLIARTRALGHPLCVGLDPWLDRIPPPFRDGPMAPGDPRTAAAVERFLAAVVDRLEGRVAIVKPQSAFFERMGWRGVRALEATCRRARARGLLVLLDAKRGDIGSTARAYAEAALAPDGPAAADAATVSPFLGRDSLAPFVEAARTGGRGLFALARTSNPGARDYQDLKVGEAGGETLSERIARSLAETAEALRGPETGWSSLGIVVGATFPEQAERLRERLPRAPFLVPGYGAQGGGADDAVRAFPPGPAGPEGGIVASSRAILFPPEGGAGSAAAWEAGFDAALDAAIDGLREALARRGRRDSTG